MLKVDGGFSPQIHVTKGFSLASLYQTMVAESHLAIFGFIAIVNWCYLLAHVNLAPLLPSKCHEYEIRNVKKNSSHFDILT